MKKVLILAYDFPPYVSVGGLRPYSWYKYFHDFGIYPIVITRQWGNKYGNHLDYIAPGESNETIIEESETGTIIRTPYKPNLSNRLLLKYGEKRFRILRKAITAWYEFMQFLFFVGPKACLYRGAKSYLKNHKVDAILATGEPFILFKYASKLSRKLNIPWVADYRDPWTQSIARSKNYLQKKWNAYFEGRYLKSVTGVVAVSNLLALKILDKAQQKPFLIAQNGFDNELLILERKKQSSDVLNIAFAGSLYPWHPVAKFLQVLSEFIETYQSKIQFNFVGINKKEQIEQLINEQFPSLVNRVVFHPRMSNKALFQYLVTQNLLLLFNDYSISGTKIYDYLVAKRRILLCFTNDGEAFKLKEKHFTIDDSRIKGHDLQAEIITHTHSGYLVENPVQLLNLLNSLYLEFNEQGALPCNSKNIRKFSRKKQTEKLVDFLINTTV